ncbi:unnamed protein product [Hapterophycus canaliculatus]
MWHARDQQEMTVSSDFRCRRRTRSGKRQRRSGCSFHDRLRCSLARASTAVVLWCCLLVRPSAGEVRSVSRVYHSACLERGQSYWDYENFRLSSLHWEDVDRYEVNGRLGFGRFSEVMEGIVVDSGRQVVLKVLKPARTYKIKREIRVLQASHQLLAGGPNILALEGVCRDRNTGTTTLILEHLGDGVQWFGHTTAASSRRPGTPGGVNAADSLKAIRAAPKGLPPPASPSRKADKGSAGVTASSIGQGRALSWRPSATATAAASVTTADATQGADLDEGLEDGNTPRAGSQHPSAAVSQEAVGNERQAAAPAAGGPRPLDGNESSGRDAVSKAAAPGRLTDYEVRLYLYKLLQALDFAHSCGVMHRDVKPRNIVINRRTRSLRLIDWGLGDFYIPGRRNMARVGSRYYKAPELLVGFRFYDYAVDIFSVGCILAGFLLDREPFFRGKDNEDQLVRIALVLGTQGLHDFLRKYDVVLEPRLLEMLGTHRKKPWSSVGRGGAVGGGSVESYGADGLDLLERMLCYDHQDRISAREALSHAFFDPVRGEAEVSVSSHSTS